MAIEKVYRIIRYCGDSGFLVQSEELAVLVTEGLCEVWDPTYVEWFPEAVYVERADIPAVEME